MSNPLDNLKAISDRARNVGVGKCTVSTIGQTYKVIALKSTNYDFCIGQRIVALQESLVPMCVLEDDYYWNNKNTNPSNYWNKGLPCGPMIMDDELEEI